MGSANSSVLIVGGGPTGLVLALWLTRIGVKVRLIDKTEEPGTTSRALVVHARTLELYRQLGISDDVLQRGFHFPNLNLCVNLKRKAQVALGDLGEGVTPFPYVVIFPQDEHENLLIEKLKELGVEVERKTELLNFQESGERVTATLRLASGEEETCAVQYLAGCDGARSTVRHTLNLAFDGSTYPDLFYVADIEGTGEALNGDLHISLDEAEFLAIFPLKARGHARLIGVIREKENQDEIKWSDVSPRLFQQMKIEIQKLHWFSTYHVHHRVVEKFKVGRVFLLGDAAHIHSPLGGQGMNTGIGDAVNLAWKLGDVLLNNASPSVLETYEPERKAFAKELVRSTDEAFQFISSTGWLAKFVRTVVVPTVLPLIFRFRFFRKVLFARLSQTGIHYRKPGAHEVGLNILQVGDRLPWIESVQNFDPLKSLSWQIHIYGEDSGRASFTRETFGLAKHVFPWSEEMLAKGIRKNAAYLIRPDGYIGEIST